MKYTRKLCVHCAAEANSFNCCQFFEFIMENVCRNTHTHMLQIAEKTSIYMRTPIANVQITWEINNKIAQTQWYFDTNLAHFSHETIMMTSRNTHTHTHPYIGLVWITSDFPSVGNHISCGKECGFVDMWCLQQRDFLLKILMYIIRWTTWKVSLYTDYLTRYTTIFYMCMVDSSICSIHSMVSVVFHNG